MKKSWFAVLLLLTSGAFAQHQLNGSLINEIRVGQTPGELISVLGEPTRALAQPGFLSYDYMYGQSSLQIAFDSLQHVKGFIFHADSALVRPIAYSSAAALRKGVSRTEILEQLGLPLVMNVKDAQVMMLYRNGAEKLLITYAKGPANSYEFSYTNEGPQRSFSAETLPQLKVHATGVQETLRLLGTPTRVVAGNDREFWEYRNADASLNLQFTAEGKLDYYLLRRNEEKSKR